MGKSPTQLSLKHIKDCGLSPWIVEKWNSFAKVRQDLYGFIDIVAICPCHKGVAGIQTTTKSNMFARIKKIKASVYYKIWVGGGNAVVVHGWYKKNNRWQLCEKILNRREPCCKK